MQNVLILGGNGALGSCLAKLLTTGDRVSRYQVTSYDRAKLDITDQQAIERAFSELKPDLIINCAAYNNLDQAETAPEPAFKINAEAVGYIAQAAKNNNALVVHFSTNYVFEAEDENGYDETATPKPQSKYAESKYRGELELQNHTDRFYLIRTALLYGYDAVSGGKPSFVQIMLKVAAEKQAAGEIPPKFDTMVDDEFGHPTYIPDLAEATLQLIEDQAPFGIYHLTNSGYTNWLGWAKEIFAIKQIPVELTPVSGEEFKRPAKRPHWGIIHNTKRPQLRPWQEALKDYLSTII